MIQRGESLGQDGGVVEARVQHGPCKARATGQRPYRRHQREGVERTIRPVLTARVHQMIGHPDRIKPLLIGDARLLQHKVHAALRVQKHAKLHDEIIGRMCVGAA